MSSAEQSWTKLLLVFNKFGILSIWDLDNLGFGQCLQRSRVRPSRCRFLINDFALKSNGGWNMMDGSIDKVQLVVLHVILYNLKILWWIYGAVHNKIKLVVDVYRVEQYVVQCSCTKLI